VCLHVHVLSTCTIIVIQLQGRAFAINIHNFFHDVHSSLSSFKKPCSFLTVKAKQMLPL